MFYRFWIQILIFLDVIFGSYYFLFLIPLNIVGDAQIRLFNLIVFIVITLAQLPYKLKCPLTVWRNKLIQKVHPQHPINESAVSAIFHSAGFKKLSLAQINILAFVFGIVTVISFVL